MQLLSALSSTTSPLAMQAMPLVASPTGDFAALIAGLVPAGNAAAETVSGERQAVAPAGNPLPVTLAAPDGMAAPEAVAPLAPPLPVSATEAVLMLPQEAAPPMATPIEQVVPTLVAAAATGVLGDVLPDKETVEVPPRAEDVAARTLPVPVPTRFAMAPPRTKRAENAPPDTPRPLNEEDGADSEPQTTDAAIPVVAAPLMVPQPADAIILPAAPQTGVPTAMAEDGATPAAAPVVEGGEVVAAEPGAAKTPPIRMAKRVNSPLPPARRAAAAAVDRMPDADKVATVAEPAVGVVTPLNTDNVVPVHVVVSSVADGAPVVASPVDSPVRNAASPPLRPTTVAASAAMPSLTPATPVPGRAPVASSFVRSTGPDAAPAAGIAPVAAVAPGGLAGVMIDLLPVDEAPLAAAAPATPAIPGIAPTVPADAAAAPVAVDAGQSAPTPDADAVMRPMAMPVAPAAPAPDPAIVSPAILSRPTARAGVAPTAPASRGNAATVERGTPTSTPVNDTVAPVPTREAIVDRPPFIREAAAPVASQPATVAPSGEATADRQPIAREAAAPVVPVAAPAVQPTVPAPPVTRIASVPVSDTASAPEAITINGASGPAPVRHAADAPASAPAAMPPVTRIAAAPVADVAPIVVDAVLRDSDAQAPHARRDDDPAIPTTGTIAAPDAALLRPVAPTAHAAQPTLDTRQPQWVEGMIDRITTLREASGTNDGETRIRLSPDALGDVEVAIRTGDDGKLHVRFNSDNADAGRLLAEAQPRLVQMAEARGLKLGGMQVDVGSQQSGQSQQSQRQAQDQGNPAPRAPRSTTRATIQTTRSDDRIA